jgi:nitrite reductase/ring-hydroxylating ferredoxin subunit
VAKVGDIEPGGSILVFVDGRDVGLFFVGGKYFAIDNSCPHQGGPLHGGWIEGETVFCPWHAWCFNLNDGKIDLGHSSVDPFDVRVEGETIFVSRTPRGSA